jgi:PAS domain S-box-containing protein
VSESERRYRTLAETASDAIITIDEDGMIVLANAAAESIFGHALPEIIGKDLEILMPEYLRHVHRAGFARYKQSGKRHLSWAGIELPGLRKDGSEVPLELSFGEFVRDGRRYFTGIARDITERKRAEQERKESEDALRHSREERLRELERVRRRIATDLHDDIGSSLTRISLLSEVAQRRISDIDQALKHPLGVIAGLSRELVDSMSDIVWAINPQKDNLSDLSQRMRHFASDVFTARQIDFHFTSPDSGEQIRVGANVRRELFLLFKEAVNNLVRHSGCTQAEVALGSDAEEITLTVTDNGRGFNLSEKRHGHGLASMRDRTEGLGGQLMIKSSHERGTTLTFKIPIDGRDAAAETAEKHREKSA